MSQNRQNTTHQVATKLEKVSNPVTYEEGTENDAKIDAKNSYPSLIKVNYKSIPITIPSDFLAPLPDPENTISIQKLDWDRVQIPEYRGCFAVILDNILNEEECKQLLHLAEKSAGAHRGEGSSPNNGWRAALIAAAQNREFLDTSYRNSDRIIWDNQELTNRIWRRIMQGKGMKEYFSVLQGDEYEKVLGYTAHRHNERWVISENALNERMRFLKYGAGQFFRAHCDSRYTTPDGENQSFFTMHLYLNDSAQALNGGIINMDVELDSTSAMLEGGATTFHSSDVSGPTYDANPKVGRVLIFQQRKLLHSGDDVIKGIKYTMRSDVMYRLDDDAMN